MHTETGSVQGCRNESWCDCRCGDGTAEPGDVQVRGSRHRPYPYRRDDLALQAYQHSQRAACFHQSAKGSIKSLRAIGMDRRAAGVYCRTVELVLGGVVIAFLVFMVVGAVTGRVKVQSCCSLSATDPRRDLRMTTAFEDEPRR